MDDASSTQRALSEAGDPSLVMRRIVHQALELIPGADGSVIELAQGHVLTYAFCAGSLADAVGTQLDMGASLSGLAVGTGATLRCDDCESDPRVDRDACRRVGAVSMVCVPLRFGSVPVGVLKVSAAYPGAFDQRDVNTLAGLAEFITTIITASTDLNRITRGLLDDTESDEEIDTARRTSFVTGVAHPEIAMHANTKRRIAQTIRSAEFATVYQPVIDLRSGDPMGVEALTRFYGGPYRPPNEWIADAHRVGLGVELELAVARNALQALDQLPSDWYLAFNVGPDAITSPALLDLLDATDAHRLVVELTEHVRVDDYPSLRRALVAIRKRGARLAIDDAGAGFASFSHIVKLAPDLIKLDLNMVRGVDLDPVRRSLASAVTAFAADTGAQVLAEGIETEGELATLRQLGIAYGQGYLLGRPGALALLSTQDSA